jgi:hypothetical protein
LWVTDRLFAIRARSPLRRLLRALAVLSLAALLAAGAFAAYLRLTRPAPQPETEIFQGVFYSCHELPENAGAGGRMLLVRVDLSAPGIELYTTPLDPDAVKAGFQHRMRWPTALVAEEKLAVAITGTLFEERGRLSQLPGGFTRSFETVVSDHAVSHVNPHTYLLWFEDDLSPHLEHTKPPSAEALARAKWGVGGQAASIPLRLAAGPPSPPGLADRRIFAGIDARKKQLFLAAFEHATLDGAERILGRHGVAEAVALDGGASASMTVGEGAQGLRSGLLMWPMRGVPVFLGVRARKLEK